ncbi:MAG TPA: hypothetical protein VIH61_09980 [Waddliaceae bacterium]
MEGDVHRNESDIIEYPENYEEMKKKYLEREEEKFIQVLARRKAESEHDLEDIASKAIASRALRAASEHKPLKDRTILREAKSEDIQDLKKKLNEEIQAIGQRILQELPKEVPSLEKKIIGLSQLKGRISQTPPPEWNQKPE